MPGRSGLWQTPLQAAKPLIRLERGADELLLANPLDLRPLYVRQGRSYLSRFLDAVAKPRAYGVILSEFPHDRDLLDTLLAHRILVAPSAMTAESTGGAPHCNCGEGKQNTVSLYLLLAQSCNMACVYCLNGTVTYGTERRLLMTERVAFQSLEWGLEKLGAGGWLEIVLFGGEPLLNWPLAQAVVHHCETSLKPKHPDKSFRYHITSNLSFLPPGLIDWALRYGVTFLCDVDGPPAIHDACRPFKNGGSTYETVAENVGQLTRAGLHVALRATVTAWNQHHLLETTQIHRELGGSSSAFVPVNPVNSDGELLPLELLASPEEAIQGVTEVYRSGLWPEESLYPFCIYAPRLEPGARTVIGCGAPCGNTAVVDANGESYPCHYFVGVDRFRLGNILPGGRGPDGDVLRDWHKELHVDHREDCAACSWRYICGGGCPVPHMTVSRHAKATDSLRAYCKGFGCDYTQRIIELVLWNRAEHATAALLSQHSRSASAADMQRC
jgi:uncharacterized protein